MAISCSKPILDSVTRLLSGSTPAAVTVGVTMMHCRRRSKSLNYSGWISVERADKDGRSLPLDTHHSFKSLVEMSQESSVQLQTTTVSHGYALAVQLVIMLSGNISTSCCSQILDFSSKGYCIETKHARMKRNISSWCKMQNLCLYESNNMKMWTLQINM